MILIIDERTPPDLFGSEPPRAHECSLQQTLRRMGFYAARVPRARTATPAASDPSPDPPGCSADRPER